ncbi:rhamnosyltransferase WsaF family glycosyltransferase [Actinopolymorpha pittospori]
MDLAVREDVPRRINLLIPTIDLDHFFGGYIAKFNLARRLAERGLRIRVVTVDSVSRLPRSWREEVETYAGLAGALDRLEVRFGRQSGRLEVSPYDAFIATTWWSAHVAAHATRSLGRGRFLYLIQEHEPFTFPMSSLAALADQSYRLPHFALFSTELLRDYFRRRRIGVYAAGSSAGEAASASFQNAITAVAPPSVEVLTRRQSRRLLFYARPESHASRNMFELGLLAIDRTLELGALRGWELRGIGCLTSGRRVRFGSGARLDLVPRTSQRHYAELLGEHDVGLALMYTPHPSLVPIEMASAGMLTVTNTFENKDPAALAAISTNLVAVEPTVEAVAEGLRRAAAGVGDVTGRSIGSEVRWSRDWDQALDEALVDRIMSFLDH